MSYLFHAFLRTEPPSAEGAKDYLLEGALFDEQPEIVFELDASGGFQNMRLKYDATRHPMILRRLRDDEGDAARGEVVDEANLWCGESVAKAIEAAAVVVEWEVERNELDEDAWFALHLWQAWVLKPAGGLLYAPGDGIFNAELRRLGGPR
jgi:hypothetical protein